jgi:hypothetical protein
MKKTTLKETEATYDDKLAMIMAMGNAMIDQGSIKSVGRMLVLW